MSILLFLIFIVFTLLVLYHRSNVLVWQVASAVYLIFAGFYGMHWLLAVISWAILLGAAAVINSEAVSRFASDFIYDRVKDSIPKLSKTEEEALSVGDTWIEQDIFRGEPDWDRLLDIPEHQLTDEEQAFVDQETEQLCAMLDDWSISQAGDLPENVWKFMKEKGFLGMVISKEYGGKGFSAKAHSDVVKKIATRSGAAAVTVMVPNSLGPGELLHHYGTDEQKKKYLPKLAVGQEVPCFALTEPGAGSDATSIRSEAIVVKKKVNNKMVLGLKINLNKRWITLAPIATLVGLAVNLRDPDGLLKDEGSEGITCVLVPRDTKNLIIGNRHIPANQGFMNGTIRGEDIFVPIDTIIGGQKMAGKGWRMLVECLSIGRSISLPALGGASTSLAYTTTGAYSVVRRQFNVGINQFEGVQEKLAEIAGLDFVVNATRKLTVAAVDAGKKPSVASAIAKYFNTENSRIAINNAMDVHAGRAVVTGERNYLFNAYQALPVSITVEGANIMTRNLLMFGQGSMACHPFVKEEFYAISAQDKAKFSQVLWGHIGYFLSNMAKTICSAWTGGRFTKAPRSHYRRGFEKVTRLSHAFAWIADLSLIILGGDLKRKERLSARLADAMGNLYMAMAALKVYQQQEQTVDYQIHTQWAVEHCCHDAQQAMIAFCHNFPNRFLGLLIRLIAFPFGQTMAKPSDKLDARLAQLATSNNQYRGDMLESIFMPSSDNEGVYKVEKAFQAVITHADLYAKLKDLKRYKFGCLKERMAEKVASGDLTQEEMDTVVEIEKARWDAIQVDEFDFEEMKGKMFSSKIDQIPTPLDN